MYRMNNLENFSAMASVAPREMSAFQAFDATALAAGAIPKKYKELIALGIALTTQCPYCLELHRVEAEKNGANSLELAEVVFVAAALRAGAAVTHGPHLLQKQAAVTVAAR